MTAKTGHWVFAGQFFSNSWLSTISEEDVIELSADRLLKIILDDRAVCYFWHRTWKEFRELNHIAIIKLLPDLFM